MNKQTKADPFSSVDFYVSNQGDDHNKGAKVSPFATLERARDAIRELKNHTGLPTAGVTVYIRGGEYPLIQSFELTEQDSGMENSPIVYCAYPGEEVRLLGGVKLDAGAFQPVSDPSIIERLPDASKVLQLDLAAAGVKEFGGDGFGKARTKFAPELYVDDQVMTIARWPNEEMITVGAVDDPGSNPRWGDQSNRGAMFEFLDERPKGWKDAADIWMFGYWFHDWADDNLLIASIDKRNNRIQTVNPSFYSVKNGQRYHYYNILEELDMEGEWYLDKTSEKLYFYPPAEFNQSRITLSQLKEPLITLHESSHIMIKDICFEACRGQGVAIQGGADNVIVCCRFLNLSDFAVMVKGGHHHGIIECQLHNTGIGGIYLEGGDRPTLTPGRHYVTDNEISNYSRLKKTYSPAVDIFGVGHRVAHNHIYNAPHLGIRINGNDHIVEYNEIHDILKETADAGAIYMGRDWSEQGNVIRYNYLYNLHGFTEGEGQIGIYLDDIAGDTLVYGNIVQNANRGMFFGGGRGNHIYNNMIVDCDVSLSFDARGLGNWLHTCSAGGIMPRSLEVMPYQEEPWRSRYPNLSNILEDRPCEPLYNEIMKNVIYNSPEPDLDPRVVERGTIEQNWVTRNDPGFIDLAAGDLRLTSNARVFSEIPGFEKIPFDLIGIRNDMR